MHRPLDDVDDLVYDLVDDALVVASLHHRVQIVVVVSNVVLPYRLGGGAVRGGGGVVLVLQEPLSLLKNVLFIYLSVVNDELSAFYLRRAVVGVPSAGRRRSPLRALHSSVLVVAHFLNSFFLKSKYVRECVF